VADGETGRIVPLGDARALADALAEVLADPELARRFGEAGRRRVTSEFGWERVAELVEDALSAGRSSSGGR
jgi:glycosyltransferase involved in cell wall biosynthesis